MVEQVMRHVRNYFIREHRMGQFSIRGCMLYPHDFLLDGQRFYITGSFLNDGVYTYHQYGIKDADDESAAILSDEDFSGIVYAMAVPPAFIALSREIGEWVGKFGEVTNSPYQSETFNGYSYTKTSGDPSSGGGLTWQKIFQSQLNQWRKVSIL